MASPGVSPRRSARVKVVALPSPPAVTHSASPQQMDARLADQPTLTRSPEAMSARSVRRPNRRKSMAAHAAQQPTRQSAVSPLAAHDLRCGPPQTVPLHWFCVSLVSDPRDWPQSARSLLSRFGRALPRARKDRRSARSRSSASREATPFAILMYRMVAARHRKQAAALGRPPGQACCNRRARPGEA